MEKLKPAALNPRQIASLIDKTQWAHEFDWDTLVKLSRYFTAYNATRGQVIFYEGAQADYMGLIVEGAIRISKTDALNQARPLAILKTSQTFGELSLIDGAPRSGLAEAIEDTCFVITTKRKLLELADVNAQLAFRVLWKISETLSMRLRHTSFKVLDAPNQD